MGALQELAPAKRTWRVEARKKGTNEYKSAIVYELNESDAKAETIRHFGDEWEATKVQDHAKLQWEHLRDDIKWIMRH